jgi:hypothetical protein
LREALADDARRPGQGRPRRLHEKYVLVLASENGPLLAEHARARSSANCARIPGIGAVTSTASLVRPELVVRPDFARMADLGVTSAAIADTLRIATAGDYDQGLAKLNLAQRQVPIVVKLPTAARAGPRLLERLTVPGKHGPVMLGNVATLSIAGGPAEIDRYDRLRNINFEIELNGQPLGEVEATALALPSLKPPAARASSRPRSATPRRWASCSPASAGHADRRAVHLHRAGAAVQGFRAAGDHPGRAGAVGARRLPGAVRHADGAVDAVDDRPDHADGHRHQELHPAHRLRHPGPPRARHDRWSALLDACRKRARPIVMTTIAMGAGMMPIAIGLGTDPSFRAPMAIVVIGGLITSTFLSLLVIPVVFTYVDDLDAFEWEPGLKLQRLSVPWGMPQWSTEATLLTLKTLILYNGHYGHDRGLDLSPVPGLMELWCDQSQLTKLDLSPVPGLRKLSCNENRLKELDLSPVPGLTSLSCIDNFLRELDLSPVPGLTSLYCLENHLSKLDLSPVPGLRELNCDENQLRKLDLSPVPKLKNLCCSRTSLRELDLSPVSGLTSLSCNENLLTKLDLSPVTGLTHLCCSKTHLRELDLSPVPGLTRLSCTENRLTVLDLRPLDNPNIDLDCDANVRIIR